MKTRLSFAVIVMLFASTFAWSQVKVGDLELKVERERYVLNETLNGTVGSLAPGENCTVTLSDSFGRKLAGVDLRRAGIKPTPFSLRIDYAPTLCCTVDVAATKGRKTSTWIIVSSPRSVWDDYPIFLTDNVLERNAAYFDAARLIGLNVDFMSPLGKPIDLLRKDFWVLIDGIMGDSFNATGGEVAPPPAGVKVKAPAGPVRSTSLSDPEMQTTWQKSFDSALEKQKDNFPVGYSLGDCLSITHGTDAVDYSFDEKTLTEFRAWVQQRYGNIGALNRVWGTKFPRWADVLPMTADEIIKTQFAKTPLGRKSYNFAPWYDHRLFMDTLFVKDLAAVVTHAHDTGRAERADAFVGVTGTFEPAAYGGYDWSQLVDVFDWFEGPDNFRSKALVNALNHRRRQPAMTLTMLSDTAPAREASRALWTGALLGDAGVVVHTGAGLVDPNGAVGNMGYALAWQFRTLRDGMGRLLAYPEMAPLNDGVAIYYSQPSVRVQWMLDAGRLAGPQGLIGRSVTDAESSELAGRLGWMELLDDMRIGYTFISSRAVLEDQRALQGISVLILPRTVCMTREEATRLSAWVQAGGTLIADSQTATFDANGLQLQDGQLDLLFGISRSDTLTAESAAGVAVITKMPIRFDTTAQHKSIVEGVTTAGIYPVEPSVQEKGAKAVLQSGRIQGVFLRKVGAGNAIYLNLSVIMYHRDRYDAAKVVGLKSLMTRLLAYVNVTPKLVVVGVEGSELKPQNVEVTRIGMAPIEVVALMRRPELLPPATTTKPPELPVTPETPEAKPAQPETPEAKPAEPEAPRVIPEVPAMPGPGRPAVPTPPGPPAPPVPPPAPEPEAPRIIPEVPAMPGPGKPAVPTTPVPPAPPVPTPAPAPEAEPPVEKPAETPAETPAEKPVEKPAQEPKKEGEEAKQPPVPTVKVMFPQICYAYDMLHKVYLGHKQVFEVPVPEDAPALIACLPYEVRNIKGDLKLQGRQVTYRFNIDTDAGAKIGTHVFHVEFRDPKDKVSYIHSISLTAKSGYASGTINFAAGDADGVWKMVVTDVVTGKSAEFPVELK